MHKQHNHQPSSRHNSNLPRIHHQISPPMHRALAEDHGGEEGAVGATAHPRRAPEGEQVDTAVDANDLGLRADAPAFVPGTQSEPVANEPTPSTTSAPTKKKPKAKNAPPPPPKVTTKSVAPDIATRIHEDIAHNLYECPICTAELGRRSRVWNCGLCWTVFHLSCVKKWSKNEGAAAQDSARRQGEGDSTTPRAWRCPGCNLPQEVFPSNYTCWCEKEVDPRSLPGLPPHSCGQTCARQRKGCPHPCDATCHAGPCAPCTAMGPTQDCFCGRNSSTKRCQDTDYENGWSCGEICGDLLPCGEHTCPRPCHEGLCGDCEERVEARCYCGKVQTEMLCSSKDEEMDSHMLHDEDGEVEDWTGCFSCGDQCNRPFDCGVHFCQKGCHPQDVQPAHCPRTPFPTAWRPVERFYRVDIHATRSATPDLVGLVCAESPYLAVADATHLCQFATKVLLSTLSVFASARLACIVVVMRVLSAVVPANRRRLSVRLCGESSSLISAQVMKMWRPNISALGCVAAC
ncbi:unnamed protein product [Aspergillus oryzae]|nr:unnamed protein product [Aspergillus oryzae]GMF90126.1 unnamed protein product [Aspergillus oryzae]GMG08377.1 unnamed protein product [Aspergillus oryzae]